MVPVFSASQAALNSALAVSRSLADEMQDCRAYIIGQDGRIKSRVDRPAAPNAVIFIADRKQRLRLAEAELFGRPAHHLVAADQAVEKFALPFDDVRKRQTLLCHPHEPSAVAPKGIHFAI